MIIKQLTINPLKGNNTKEKVFDKNVEEKNVFLYEKFRVIKFKYMTKFEWLRSIGFDLSAW